MAVPSASKARNFFSHWDWRRCPNLVVLGPRTRPLNSRYRPGLRGYLRRCQVLFAQLRNCRATLVALSLGCDCRNPFLSVVFIRQGICNSTSWDNRGSSLFWQEIYGNISCKVLIMCFTPSVIDAFLSREVPVSFNSAITCTKKMPRVSSSKKACHCEESSNEQRCKGERDWALRSQGYR